MSRSVRPLSPIEVPPTPGSYSSTSVDSPFSTYSWENFRGSPNAAPGVGVLDMFKLPPTPKPKRRRFSLFSRKNKIVPGGAYDSNDSSFSNDSGDSRIVWRRCTPPPSPRSRERADREAWKAQHCREKCICRLLGGGFLSVIFALFTLL